MKVYMIEMQDWEDHDNIGVFSSLKKAEQYLSEHKEELDEKYMHPKYGIDIYDYEVNELLKGD